MKRTGFIVLFAIASVVMSRLLASESLFIERYYYGGFFQILRVLYDYTLGFLPVPSMYLFLALILYLIYRLVKLLRVNGKSTSARLFSAGLFTINTVSLLIICFYWFWGYNYNRVSIEQSLQLDSEGLDSTALMSLLDWTVDELVTIQDQFDKDSLLTDLVDHPVKYENLCRENMESTLEMLGYASNGRVRIRRLYPKGSLLRISTAGVYWPFVFEGHIDPGLHPISWSFTMMHEMGHGYGFADEGTCNFLGWLACIHSEHPLLQYSAWMGYLRYVLSNLGRSVDKADFHQLYDALPLFIKTDLDDMREYAMRYPDILPEIRDVFYHEYLKSHGVKGGLINYSKVVRLVYAWQKKEDR